MPNNPNSELEEESSGYSGFTLLSILRAIWKRKVIICAAWVLFAIGAVAVVRSLAVVYMAEATVLIDSQKIPEKFVSATVDTELEDRIASIRQMLLSGGALRKVISDFDLYREQRKTHFEEEILEMIRKDITITMDTALPGNSGGGKTKRPGAFRIGYQGPDPDKVMKVANRLADLYVEQNLKTREGQASGTSDFLETQVREAKKSLDEMEATVSSYKLSHNGELPQQETSLAGTLARLQTELEVNRDAMNRANQTKVILQSSVNASETTLSAQTRAWEQTLRQEEAVPGSSLLPNQPAPAAPRAKASEALEDQLAILRGRYKENHPDIVRILIDIEKTKRLEAQKLKLTPEVTVANTNPTANATASRTPMQTLREPPEFARTREQIAVLKAQVKAADTELENRKVEQQRILRDLDLYQRRMEHLPVREQEMAQITRDYEISKANYKSLLNKKMDAEMSLDMERRQQSERFVVLDRARLPEKPTKPNRPALYAAGMGGGLLLALLLGFAVELRKNVFLGEWELPAGTPILARLPYIEIEAVSNVAIENSRGWFSRGKELKNVTVGFIILSGAVTLGVYAFLYRI